MNRRRGFTLVEILVALTMFGLVGGLLLQVFGSGLNNTALATETSHAALLARSRLTELQAYPNLEPGLYQGELDQDYRWQAELTDTVDSYPPATNALVPLQLALTVSWGDAGDERQYRIDSVLLTSPEATR